MTTSVDLNDAAAVSLTDELPCRDAGSSSPRTDSRVGSPVTDIHGVHRAANRPVFDECAWRASEFASSLAVADDRLRIDPDRMLKLIDFDAVAEHDPRLHRVREHEPTICHRTGAPTGQGGQN